MKLTIGVMGSSGGELSADLRKEIFRLGEAITEQNAILFTGGCPGLPYEAVRGAKSKAGITIGISPGLSIEEHQGKYRSPIEDATTIQVKPEGEIVMAKDPVCGMEVDENSAAATTVYNGENFTFAPELQVAI